MRRAGQPGGRPRVSLCVVARNEADVIGACLASAAAVADERVVVDTGSTDGTPDVARAAGARVFIHAYPGDQARAFDLPLCHARGDWILVLDADEILDAAALRIIPRLVRSAACDGYFFIQRNYSPHLTQRWRRTNPLAPVARGARGYLDACSVRLFRAHAAVRYAGRLHQSVLPSLLARGGRVAASGLIVHHYGWLRRERAAMKSDLYLALQRRQVEAVPDHARAWTELGLLYLGRHQPAQAERCFSAAVRLGYGPDADYLRGVAWLERGRPRDAQPLLRRALRAFCPATAMDYEPVDVWCALSRAARLLGQPRAAEAACTRALRLVPGHPAAANDRILLRTARGAYGAAWREVRRQMELDPDDAVLWATRGTLALTTGATDEALRACALALESDPAHLPARINLAGLWLQQGARTAALRQYRWVRAITAHRAETRAWRVFLPRRLTWRETPPPAPTVRSGAVVFLVERLGDVEARLIALVASALEALPQAVIVHAPGAPEEDAVPDMLRARGMSVWEALTPREREAVLRRCAPRAVIQLWRPESVCPTPRRVGHEPWVAWGLAAVPLPAGYDAYVVGSVYQRRLQGHLPAARVRLIPYGVDRAALQGDCRGAEARPVTIACHARLEPGYFPARFLAHLPRQTRRRMRVVVAGLGARRVAGVRDDAARLSPTVALAGPHFIGRLPADASAAFWREADIGLCVTETVEEAYPVTAIEMLAAGLPVVAQSIGAWRELVRPGRNGWLTASEGETAERLRQLVDDPVARARLSAGARRTAARFDRTAAQRAWWTLIHAVLGPGGIRNATPGRGQEA